MTRSPCEATSTSASAILSAFSSAKLRLGLRNGCLRIGNASGRRFHFAGHALQFHLGLIDRQPGGGQFARDAAALFLHLAHGNAGAGGGFGQLAYFMLPHDELCPQLVDDSFHFFLFFFHAGGFPGQLGLPPGRCGDLPVDALDFAGDHGCLAGGPLQLRAGLLPLGISFGALGVGLVDQPAQFLLFGIERTGSLIAMRNLCREFLHFRLDGDQFHFELPRPLPPAA